MTTCTIELLSPGAKRILEDLEYVGLIAINEAESPGKTRHVMELKGLGAEIRKDEIVADYIPNHVTNWSFLNLRKTSND